MKSVQRALLSSKAHGLQPVLEARLSIRSGYFPRRNDRSMLPSESTASK